MTRILKGFVVGLSLLVAACGNHGCRCHTGHYEVRWHEPYQTLEEICVTHDEDGNQICSSYLQNHPAECSKTFECDVTCNAFDTGKAESHERHPTRFIPLVNLHPPLCTDNGDLR